MIKKLNDRIDFIIAILFISPFFLWSLHYGTENQSPIDQMTDVEAKKYQEEGHFQQGSMWPKIRSAIHFLKHHGKKVIITNIDNLQDAIDGKAGTTIVKG